LIRFQESGYWTPNPVIVDAIYNNATCKLPPTPLNPGETLSSNIHNNMIRLQLHTCPNKKLIAGHKKDVVPSNREGHVAIYGWHNMDGKVIQPYSTLHESFYHDYSHGLRLMFPLAIVNGKIVSDYDKLIELLQ